MKESWKFDTRVQYIKYRVLTEVAKYAWEGTLTENILNIPHTIIPGKTPTMRCCVYKERAIIGERVKMAMGGDRSNPNIIQVIDIACDECPVGGYVVTDLCRGCLAHICKTACKFGAISHDENHIAHIDKTKCKECGACAKACPYMGIVNRIRPCENACKVHAISPGEDGAAVIDNDKCVSCGACSYQCPFGAITDTSSILDVVNFIKESENNTKYKVFAVIAPAIASQFRRAKLTQVATAIRKLGFYSVTEAALGADLVAAAETRELVEHGSLTSSCCPAFVSYIEKYYPDLIPHISGTDSPMVTLGRFIKTHNDETAKVVFIGPCTAKKMEAKKEKNSPWVDAVITFEELQALFASKDIEPSEMEESELDGASYFGRIFARCGGLADAVKEGLKEIGEEDFELNAVSCSGLEECKRALTLMSKGKGNANFIEGMACIGGCVGGSGCINHSEISRQHIENFSREAGDKEIIDSIADLVEKTSKE